MQRRWVLFVGSRWRERRPLAEARPADAGWHVSYVADVAAALPACRQIAFDAVVLDQAALARRFASPSNLTGLRQALSCPLLVTSDQPDEVDEAMLLEQGADDFIAWPIAPRRLRARLNAACRGRSASAIPVAAPNGSARSADVGWWLDAPCRALRRGFERVGLTPLQETLLAALLRQPGRLHAHTELVDHARQCGANPCASEIRIHIHRLRQRLFAAGVHDLRIETVRGRGYVLHPVAVA